MVCLALELIGPWVVLGFSVGVEAFDKLLSINIPWSQEFHRVNISNWQISYSLCCISIFVSLWAMIHLTCGP